MTLQERFEKEKIDLDFLEELEELSHYWHTCVNFVIENWRVDERDLSQKQSAWFERIIEDAVEKKIEGKYYV